MKLLLLAFSLFLLLAVGAGDGFHGIHHIHMVSSHNLQSKSQWFPPGHPGVIGQLDRHGENFRQRIGRHPRVD